MRTHTSKLPMVCLALLLWFPCHGLAQDVQSDEPEKSYIIPAVEIVGFDFALNRYGYRFVNREDFNIGWASIRRNLKRGWVIDKDEFEINQFLHPYQGSVYHTAARSAGL